MCKYTSKDVEKVNKKNKEISEDLAKKRRGGEEEPNFGGWLFRKEGTVAEPWTTAEKFLADKEAQEEIKRVRALFKKVKVVK